MGKADTNETATDTPELESHTETSVIKQTVTRKWQSYIWDTFDKSPEERRFLFKLDFALLTFASLGVSRWITLLEHFIDSGRIFHQISRSNQYQQCLCIRNVGFLLIRMTNKY